MSKKNKRQAYRQPSSLAAKVIEFNPDYTIIKHDLKRIGILAGTFFAILIVLGIFQNQLLALFIK
jgi:hypothetical protein